MVLFKHEFPDKDTKQIHNCGRPSPKVMWNYLIPVMTSHFIWDSLIIYNTII